MKIVLAWFLVCAVAIVASTHEKDDTPKSSKDKSSMMATVWSWMTDNPVVRAAKSLMSTVIAVFKPKEKTEETKPETHGLASSKTKVECGTIEIPSSTSTRLLGAEGAQRHSRPWYIYLKANFDVHAENYILPRKCGASLIPVKGNKYESDIIVTSALCLTDSVSHTKTLNGEFNAYSVHYNDKNAKFQAFAGLHHDEDDVQGNPIEIELIFHHTGYEEDDRAVNDIALIKLARPLQFGKTVRPICLPNEKETPIGKDCVLSGFGHNGRGLKDLQTLPVTAMSAEHCRTNRNGRFEWYTEELDKLMVCAEINKEGGEIQAEDVGGPMDCIDKASSTWHLFGIMTLDSEFEGSVEPVVCTRVPYYHQWIVTLANGITSVV